MTRGIWLNNVLIVDWSGSRLRVAMGWPVVETTDFPNYFDFSSKPSWKYQLKRSDGKLKWTKNELVKKTMANPEKKPTETNRVGCGKNLKWSALPKLDDALILELFKVKTIEQAKQLIQEGNFGHIRHDYENSIDSTFHSWKFCHLAIHSRE